VLVWCGCESYSSTPSPIERGRLVEYDTESQGRFVPSHTSGLH
jgi:hypothetical protein